jgi:hypothetical protein
MTREVTSVTRETRQPHEHALEKEVVEVECGDGAEYVFERPTDREGTAFRLARRVKPDGTISTSKAALPAAVKETIEATVSGWHK